MPPKIIIFGYCALYAFVVILHPKKMMKTISLFLSLLVLTPMAGHSQDTDTARVTNRTSDRFHGEIYMEANHGFKHDEPVKNVWDFPHVVFSAEADLGGGWSVATELEYERFHEDGRWNNVFRDNFTINQLYVGKSISKEWQLKLGIQPLPIGAVNRGAEAMTIYDAASEAAIVPMTWHEAAVGLSWRHDDWLCQVIVPFIADLPLKRSHLFGLVGRVDYEGLLPGLQLGLSGFCGSANYGMLQDAAPEDVVCLDGMAIAALDWQYEDGGWLASGSAILSSEQKARTVGCELGYDVMQLFTPLCSFRPFVRFDGIYADITANQYTVGAHFLPFSGFNTQKGTSLLLKFLSPLCFKAQWAVRRLCGSRTLHRWDIGVGYTVEIP